MFQILMIAAAESGEKKERKGDKTDSSLREVIEENGGKRKNG